MNYTGSFSITIFVITLSVNLSVFVYADMVNNCR